MMPKYQLNINNTDNTNNTNNTKDALKAAYEQQEIQVNKERAVTWEATQPFAHNNTIKWEDTYIIEPSGKMTKIHKNASAPFNMIADENPVYNSASRTFREAKLRLDEQILNSANNDVDCCYNISVDSSQRSGETQEQ